MHYLITLPSLNHFIVLVHILVCIRSRVSTNVKPLTEPCGGDTPVVVAVVRLMFKRQGGFPPVQFSSVSFCSVSVLGLDLLSACLRLSLIPARCQSCPQYRLIKFASQIRNKPRAIAAWRAQQTKKIKSGEEVTRRELQAIGSTPREDWEWEWEGGSSLSKLKVLEVREGKIGKHNGRKLFQIVGHVLEEHAAAVVGCV